MIRLICGEHSIQMTQPLIINLSNLGCSMLGNGDLYDHCFSPKELAKHGLTLEVDAETVVHWPPEKAINQEKKA